MPDAFGNHLKALGLHYTQTVFSHYQNRSIKANDWFDEGVAEGWCEHMDSLLVHILHLPTLSKYHLSSVGKAQLGRQFTTGSPGRFQRPQKHLYGHSSHH